MHARVKKPKMEPKTAQILRNLNVKYTARMYGILVCEKLEPMYSREDLGYGVLRGSVEKAVDGLWTGAPGHYLELF